MIGRPSSDVSASMIVPLHCSKGSPANPRAVHCAGGAGEGEPREVYQGGGGGAPGEDQAPHAEGGGAAQCTAE